MLFPIRAQSLKHVIIGTQRNVVAQCRFQLGGCTSYTTQTIISKQRGASVLVGSEGSQQYHLNRQPIRHASFEAIERAVGQYAADHFIESMTLNSKYIVRRFLRC